MAAWNGHKAIVKLHCTTRKGWPLWWAVARGHNIVAKVLMSVPTSRSIQKIMGVEHHFPRQRDWDTLNWLSFYLQKDGNIQRNFIVRRHPGSTPCQSFSGSSQLLS